MAKITRATQKIFGSTAGTDQIAKFGSLAAAAPVRYTGAAATPANIQALSQYLSGWSSAVLGGNSPAIEDMNALCWLFARQLAYIFQAGIPEWDSATTYYIGSIAQDGSGNQYISRTDDNLNNALTDTTNWAPFSTSFLPRTITGADSLIAADAGKVVQLNPSAAFNLQLPNPALVANKIIRLKDISGVMGTFNVTLVRFGSETVEFLASNYILKANAGSWNLYSDGTNFKFV